MRRSFTTAGLTALAAGLLAAGPVLAESAYLGAFNARYGTIRTRLDDCTLCHPRGRTSRFNEYGAAFRKRLSLGASNALIAIEAPDSDGDGHRNIDEIKAHSLPGDPDDRPSGTPTRCTDDDEDGFYTESPCGTAVDCDDGYPTIYPGALEVCGDGVDQDCDGADAACRPIRIETRAAHEGAVGGYPGGGNNHDVGAAACDDPYCFGSHVCPP